MRLANGREEQKDGTHGRHSSPHHLSGPVLTRDHDRPSEEEGGGGRQHDGRPETKAVTNLTQVETSHGHGPPGPSGLTTYGGRSRGVDHSEGCGVNPGRLLGR